MSQAAGAIRMRRQDRTAGARVGAGAGNHAGPPRLNHRPAIGLLIVRNPHHVDLALEAKHLSRKTERAAPLPCARLGRQPCHALLLVVVGLRHCRVGLVAPGGANALILVIDMGGCVQRLLPPTRAIERRRSPQCINVAHLVGNLDIPLGADLLLDQLHREQWGQVRRTKRLLGAGMQRRRQLHSCRGQIGVDVVPVGRYVLFGKHDFRQFSHDTLPPGAVGIMAGESK